jgi:heme exporter protein C
VGIIGVLDIPLIHVSVSWLRSLHPEAVVLNPDGPTLDGSMLATLLVGLLAYSLIFVCLFTVRYATELIDRGTQIQDV